jgi:hypothetical protein
MRFLKNSRVRSLVLFFATVVGTQAAHLSDAFATPQILYPNNAVDFHSAEIFPPGHSSPEQNDVRKLLLTVRGGNVVLKCNQVTPGSAPVFLFSDMDNFKFNIVAAIRSHADITPKYAAWEPMSIGQMPVRNSISARAVAAPAHANLQFTYATNESLSFRDCQNKLTNIADRAITETLQITIEDSQFTTARNAQFTEVKFGPK